MDARPQTCITHTVQALLFEVHLGKTVEEKAHVESALRSHSVRCYHSNRAGNENGSDKFLNGSHFGLLIRAILHKRGRHAQ